MKQSHRIGRNSSRRPAKLENVFAILDRRLWALPCLARPTLNFHWDRDTLMAKWVTRRGLDGKVLRSPELAIEDGPVTRVNGHKTVNERIASLIGPNEIVEGGQGLRRILINGLAVGFIEISADRPPR